MLEFSLSEYLTDATLSRVTWIPGKSIVVKADHHHVTCYFKDKTVATHWRCWQRKQRIELPQHREAAQKHHRRHWYSQEVAAFVSLGEIAKRYLEHLVLRFINSAMVFGLDGLLK